jgi:hypothetical protein
MVSHSGASNFTSDWRRIRGMERHPVVLDRRRLVSFIALFVIRFYRLRCSGGLHNLTAARQRVHLEFVRQNGVIRW